ncbi:hypothetical protein OOZ19_25125 [Saccharopolyspora sp. NFXS83]|uniref:hypothetical protein n=1 Tax=Saccharopolyspora sp. NFXS83 TaxID=2993560 RepID=UPI00224AF2CF|nr:hypothetical protein [Saccharopolyspora sp. NFXS83]MCX2733538.1 hypothetical protein [Saccharopolyspora sp. NFXS83]
MSLTPHQYRELLAAIPSTVDADTSPIDPRTLFTPSSHRLSLDPDVTIVRGGRGVGKSVWFQALQKDQLRELAAEEYRLPQLRRIVPHPGHGAALLPARYPDADTIRAMLDRGAEPRDIWYAVVLQALEVPEVRALPKWSARVEWVRDNPEDRAGALARADEEAERAGRTELVMFDALERTHQERSQADRLATAILRVALELRMMTRHLRAKVFIRPDMLNNLSLNFADSSKLISNAAELTWTRSNLYGLFFHQLGNAESDHAEVFRSSTGRWRESQHRYVAPDALTGDRERQNATFIAIAGPYMGQNHRKGHTYTWLPNHLADGTDQISPRSFLEALRRAGESSGAQHAGYEHALHWDAIKKGVQAASETRVGELTEDIRWVPVTIKPLAGKQVPISQADVAARWGEVDLPKLLDEHQRAQSSEQGRQETKQQVSAGPRNHRAESLVEELIELGVMKRRTSGMLDLPDIYRITFDLGRKGGVPRVRPN